MEFSYSIKRTLTEEDIKDILTTAIEGGIGYWSILDNSTAEWKAAGAAWRERRGDGEKPCFCDTAFELLSKGESIRFIDAETEDEYDPGEDEVWYLDMEGLLKGCQMWENRTGKNLAKAIEDCDYDAEDADEIIQYGLFGEVVFG